MAVAAQRKIPTTRCIDTLAEQKIIMAYVIAEEDRTAEKGVVPTQQHPDNDFQKQ